MEIDVTLLRAVIFRRSAPVLFDVSHFSLCSGCLHVYLVFHVVLLSQTDMTPFEVASAQELEHLKAKHGKLLEV